MTPRATASPLGGAVGGKELPAVPTSVGNGGSGAPFSAALASLRLDPAATAVTAVTAASVLVTASAPEESASAPTAAATPVPVPPAEPGSETNIAQRAQVALATVLQQLRSKPPAPATPAPALPELATTEPAATTVQAAEAKALGAGKGKSAMPAKRAAASKDDAGADGAAMSLAGAALLLATIRSPAGDTPAASSLGRGKSPSVPAEPADLAVTLASGNAPQAATQPAVAISGPSVPADANALASSSGDPLDAPAKASVAVLADLVSDIAVRSQARGSAPPDDGDSTAADSSSLAGRVISGLTGAQPGAPAATVQSAAPATALSIAVPVADRQWAHAVATRVLVLAGQKIESATLHVNPEHLGPIDVHIDMQASHVNVSFGAAHLDTRSALELALPQLRQVLAGAGLTLGEATVQQQLRRESQNAPNATRGAEHAADSDVELVQQARRRLTLIDEYV